MAHLVLQDPSAETLLHELDNAHRYRRLSGHRPFGPSAWITEPFVLSSPCAFREKPGTTTRASPPPRTRKEPHQDLQWLRGVSPLPAAAPAPFKSKRLCVWLCNLRMWTSRQDTGVNINLALTHRQSLAVWHRARSPPHRGLRKTTAGAQARVLLLAKAGGGGEIPNNLQPPFSCTVHLPTQRAVATVPSLPSHYGM